MKVRAWGTAAAALTGLGLTWSCVSDAPTAPITIIAEAGAPDSAQPDGSEQLSDATSLDAGTASDATTTTDSGPACDLSQPFNTPSAAIFAAVNTVKQESSPRLAADELTLYYALYPGMGVNNESDVYVATRGSISDPFSSGTTLSPIDTQDVEADPTLTGNGLTIYYTVDALNGTLCNSGTTCIATATRSAVTAAFANPTIQVDVSGQEITPYVLPNGQALYYAFDAISTAGYDLWSIAGDTLLAKVNGPADETAPVVTADNLTLYFGSTRLADGGVGTDANIYVATRSVATDAFGAPKLVSELSSPSGEVPGFISADGCRMYFTRDDGASGSLNLYYASKP